jgi:hypothetical protein
LCAIKLRVSLPESVATETLPTVLNSSKPATNQREISNQIKKDIKGNKMARKRYKYPLAAQAYEQFSMVA